MNHPEIENRRHPYARMAAMSVLLLLIVPLSAYAAKSLSGIDLDPNYHAWENFDF